MITIVDQRQEFIDFMAEVQERVLQEAKEFWVRAACVYDFCIQAIGPHCLVFGAVNRITWCVSRGFQVDESYCTEKFIIANQHYLP